LRLFIAIAIVATSVASAGAGTEQRMVARASASFDGGDAAGESENGDISANGRFVAYWSDAENLLGPEPNNNGIFIRDLIDGTTREVTTTIDGKSPNWSRGPSVSASGQFIAFYSIGSNLVPGDEDYLSGVEDRDVFVKDMEAESIVRVSVGRGGQAPNGESGGPFGGPEISHDGRYVVFTSSASNLVRGDENAGRDAFRYDLVSGRTRLVSLRGDGRQFGSYDLVSQPVISPNGRFIAFSVSARSGHRTRLYLRDLKRNVTIQLDRPVEGKDATGFSEAGGVTWQGDVVFASSGLRLVAKDSNEAADVHLFNRRRGTIRRISLAKGGGDADGGSASPDITSDGQFIVYESFATNLAAGDHDVMRDIFIYNRRSRWTRLVSRGCNGKGNAWSMVPTVSRSGQLVAFDSDATNLDTPDGNEARDVFVRDMATAC
jgi:Tol biopolymer transport system component